MPLMATCVSRLGSRYNLILDPVRRKLHYGALGLLCQTEAELVVGIDDGRVFSALPFSCQGEPFYVVDQQLTMTSVVYEAFGPRQGVRLRVEVLAPFYPQDRDTSTVPAYVFNFRVSPLNRVRWRRSDEDAPRKGVIRFGLHVPGAKPTEEAGGIKLTYPVQAGKRADAAPGRLQRKNPIEGISEDLIFGLSGDWVVRNGFLETAFDVSDDASQEFSLAVAAHCDDALFERFGRPMKLIYTAKWYDVHEVADFVRKNHAELVRKSRVFDAVWTESTFPRTVQDLSALSFQSFLMNTMWTVGEAGAEWFSVWEGSCWYNSTVDVTYNDALFYFACWPQLLEMIFSEWAEHANDVEAERRRQQTVSEAAVPGQENTAAPRKKSAEKTPETAEGDFPGAILEHDMGAGWTANGQSYHHAMPVEENADFLLLLYAHGKWWGRQSLFRKYHKLNKALVEYLLWADSTGNGFPDRGTANTIDDATPAVQYGRDNVYLGVKRLAALHAAMRMFEYTGDKDLAKRCRSAVRQAVRTLNAGWLGDHWGVCLDKSAEGLSDCWSGEPLPYKVLPGWDAYTLYTTNGLLYLMMVDDLPTGMMSDRLRQDLREAMRHSMTTYGCGHSSTDKGHVWISVNIWRDCAGGYLGENLLSNCERYWAQQVFGNSQGSDKPNCFTETSVSNNLVWYPRGAAIFGLAFSTAGLVMDGPRRRASVKPLGAGRWPLLPLADWRRGKVPELPVQESRGKLVAVLPPKTGKFKVTTRR